MTVKSSNLGMSKETMGAISAPYNFVPLSEKIVLPDWHQQVSHDWPFQDGISGEIQYRLIADSPLLVGGEQKPATAENPGEVHPFKLPDGHYAIPGSSLKGMLRSVVEIAGFGRMRNVDDVRPGLRDITGEFVKGAYAERVRDAVKTGFLYRQEDGSHEIHPCSMTRLSHRKIEDALEVNKPVFKTRQNVKEKYDYWQRICHHKGLDAEVVHFNVDNHEAVSLGTGKISGFPVFTGQISDSTNASGKKKDFVFYDEVSSQRIPVARDVWRDFLAIHGDEKGNDEMSWPGYWRDQYRAGKRIPVFYLEDHGLLRIGLAYMPKLAGDYSTHDIIRHASEEHQKSPGRDNGYDLADLLFGAIGEHADDSLRGRVSCKTAVAKGDVASQQVRATILNGPNVGYFPNYVTQQVRSGKGLELQGRQFTTYMESTRKPIARGFKRYPARPVELTAVQSLSIDQESNKKVQVKLNPLPAGVSFDGSIVFHNLKPVELGALLWAISWGNNTQFRHGLGMGKPFGFGQVRFELTTNNCQFIANEPTLTDKNKPDIDGYIHAFTQYMESNIKTGWNNSDQISNLLAMADPISATRLPGKMQLRHMHLNSKQRVNEFTWAKQKGLVLADYATATQWNTRQNEIVAQEKERKKEAERLQDEEVIKQEQAAFESLPEHEKAILNFKKDLSNIPDGPLDKDRFGQVLGCISQYIEQAIQWPEKDKREAMAVEIHQQFDRIGWHSSGLKKKQRDRQRKKNEDKIANLQSGK